MSRLRLGSYLIESLTEEKDWVTLCWFVESDFD